MAQINEYHGQQRTGSVIDPGPTHVEEHAKESVVSLADQSYMDDPWQELKRFTRARIALGRVGISLPTKEILNFGLSHALARDAVHLSLDVVSLVASIQSLGFSTIHLHSKAVDRNTYLLRPDLGRRLDDKSKELLQTYRPKSGIDFLIVVGDGLSSLAIQHHVVPLLSEMHKCIPDSWTVGPVVVAEQARVAIADDVGEIMGARMVVMLIGERPGLSSPNSLGIYLTYAPKVSCSDADRNCISNVRPEGLQYATAASKLIWLAKTAMNLKISGVTLKDESEVRVIGSHNNLE